MKTFQNTPLIAWSIFQHTNLMDSLYGNVEFFSEFCINFSCSKNSNFSVIFSLSSCIIFSSLTFLRHSISFLRFSMSSLSLVSSTFSQSSLKSVWLSSCLETLAGKSFSFLRFLKSSSRSLFSCFYGFIIWLPIALALSN